MENLIKIMKPYIGIGLGMLLYALGVVFFIIPTHLVGGGVVGIATIIYYTSHISTGITVFLLNIGLIFLGIKYLGGGFGVKTVFGICTLSAWLSLLQFLFQRVEIVDDPLLSSLIAGGLLGMGLGIAFHHGGSSGGLDIPAMILNKYYNYSPGRIILACNIIIIASGWLIFHDIKILVYSYVCTATMSYALDSFLSGSKRSIQMFISSYAYEELCNVINKETHSKVTVLETRGDKNTNPILMLVVKKKESLVIYKKIKKIDPTAFVSQNEVMGVYGEGS